MKKIKLLIVEDDEVLQKALSDYFSEENFSVLCASDGETGLRIAKSENPDLILLDIILPRKDGYEVIKEIRLNEKMKDTPVVLLTNLGSLNDVEKALNLGATTYLVKADYKLEEIAEKIKTILEVE
jgi:DNA-binding response OmpR family regulator